MASLTDKVEVGVRAGPAIPNEAGARLLRLEDGTGLEIMEYRYPGGARGLLLTDAESREPYAILTVNVPGTELEPDEILVKTWSENEQVAGRALQDPRFEDTGHRVATKGYTDAQVWRYRPDAVAAPKAEGAGPAWRGTLSEAITMAVGEHGVEAFAGADWRTRARPQKPQELAAAVAQARGQVESGRAEERVYTVRPDGTIYNTATNRDEWVPVKPEAGRERGDGAPRPPGGVSREGSAPGASVDRDPAKAEPEVAVSLR